MKRLFATLLALWLAPTLALGQEGTTRVFDGGSAAPYNTNWNFPENWDPDGVPDALSHSIIPYAAPYVAVTGPDDVTGTLEISETGRLVVKGADNGKTLTVVGDFENRGTVNIAGTVRDNGPVIKVGGDIINHGLFDLRGVSRTRPGLVLTGTGQSFRGSRPVILQNLTAGVEFTVDGVTVYVAGQFFAPEGLVVTTINGGQFILGEPPPTVPVTADAGDGGSIAPGGTTEVTTGSSLPYEVVAGPGFHVAAVSVNGVPVFETAQPASDPAAYRDTLENVSESTTIAATFDVNYYAVRAVAADAGGAVAVDADAEPFAGSPDFYAHGTAVTVTATAVPGFYFTGWTTVDGGVVVPVPADNPFVAVLTGPVDLTANFAEMPEPATFEVNALDDAALRAAIEESNARPGTDAIVFNPSLAGAVELVAPLPLLADAVEIRGATDADGNPRVTIRPGDGFVPDADLPDGLQLSGVFLGFGYTPERSTIADLAITGFPGAGICIGSDGNVIQGLVISGNGDDGICIVDGSQNLIGGTAAGQGNEIFANGGSGIVVTEASTDDEIAPPAENAFQGNSIYGNGGLGIDLANRIGELGLTWNRFPDGATSDWGDYINRAQNFPDLYFASTSLPTAPEPAQVIGNLYGAPGTYRLEFFLSDPDASGAGEGRTPVGALDGVVISGADGLAQWAATLAVPLFGGEYLTATATDANGNSSEFSPNLLAGVLTRRFGAIEAPADPHNRWVINTTFGGVPLYWPGGDATVRMGSSFFGSNPGAPFRAKMAEAVAEWNAAAADAGVPLTVTLDPAEAPDVWGGTPDGSNTAVFYSSGWASTGAPEGALAVTRVRYNAATGAITDADIAFNGEFFEYQNYGTPPDPAATPDTWADFLAVDVHEGLHAFGGLADRYNPGDPFYTTLMGLDVTGPLDPVTMYGIIRPTDTYQRTVHADDKAALQFIYGSGAAPSSSVALMLLIDGSQSFADPGSFNGFAASKDAIVNLVDLLREGDYVGVQKLTDPAPTIPLTEVVDQSTRDALKADIELLVQPDATDTRPLGSALVTAAGQFGSLAGTTRAIIALTAGNETEAPSALSPAVLGAVSGAGANVFGAGGYAQSIPGQATLSALSDATGGAYFETSNLTVGPVVAQIWSLLTGYQLVGDSTLASDAISWQGANPLAISWQGTSNLAISWQGRAEEGTTALLPAISWQGRNAAIAKVSATAGLAENGDAKFVLALVPPGFDETVLYSWPAGTPDPYGVITPFNVGQYAGVTYVQGPTYAFYEITGEFANNPPLTQYLLPGSAWGDLGGVWKLVPVGDNATPLPPFPYEVYASLFTSTDVVLVADLGKSSYNPQEPVAITATLFEGGQVQGAHTVGGGPIVDATVYADIARASLGSPVRVALAHAGNGVYRGTFSQTGEGGTYSVVVRAEGVAPLSGQEFTRESKESFYVVSPLVDAVLFAERSIVLGQSSTVHSGDILVNRDAGDGAGGVELYVDKYATTPSGFDVKADRIAIRPGAFVGGDVFYNALDNGGTITGELTTPLSLPLGLFPPFEEPDPGVSGAENVVVRYRRTATLTPGVYGDVYLQSKATLRLEPGSYSFRSLLLSSSSSVEYSGPTRVRLLEDLHTGSYAQIEPRDGSEAAASDFVVFVRGADVRRGCGCSYAVHLGWSSDFRGSISAPNGTVFMSNYVDAVGAYFGQDIIVCPRAEVSLASAFGPLTKPADEDGPDGETTADKEVPTAFSLAQNYPNPFNPTTEIKYGLPQQTAVSLVVFNMLGQEVARLVDEVQPEGYYVVRWNGTNRNGHGVSSGMYIYQLRAGDYVDTRKMMLLK